MSAVVLELDDFDVIVFALDSCSGHLHVHDEVLQAIHHIHRLCTGHVSYTCTIYFLNTI